MSNVLFSSKHDEFEPSTRALDNILINPPARETVEVSKLVKLEISCIAVIII